MKKQPISIGAALGRYREVKGQAHLSKKGDHIAVYQVENDSQQYVLGFEACDALKIDPVLLVGRDGLNRYTSAFFAKYAKMGLALAVGSRTPAQILLVSTTPAREYLDERVIDTLTTLFKTKHTIRVDGKTKELDVTEYFAMSETEAILYDYYLDENGGVKDDYYEDHEVFIINAGFGTTDISYYNGLQYIPIERETVTKSYLDIVQRLKDFVAEKVKREITTQEVAKQLALQEGCEIKTFTYAGEEVEKFHDRYVEVCRDVFEELKAELNLIIEDPDRAPRILVGGGAAVAEIWGQNFKSWSRRVTIASEPEYSAVRGGKKFGEYMKRELDAPTLFVGSLDTGNGKLKVFSDATFRAEADETNQTALAVEE